MLTLNTLKATKMLKKVKADSLMHLMFLNLHISCVTRAGQSIVNERKILKINGKITFY